MANYSKAFNFRGGFQVDTDVLLVRGQNVGIGSTIPEERLDVDGTIFTRGLRIEADTDRGDITQIDKANVGVLSVTENLYVGVADTTQNQNFFPFIRPAVRITTGIITSADPAIGVVTYYGDGGSLLNLPTSQWLDVDPGIGFTSIYAQGNVGVGTTMPVHTFQVGGSPFPREFVGMNVGFQTGIGMEKGNIYASGIVSTRGEFSGIGSLITNMDARNLGIGTIPVERYGPLIVTDTVIAKSFIGTATTAIGVRTDSFLDFDRGRANELEAVSRFISSEGKLQIGNVSYFDPANLAGDIDIVKTSQTTVYALSENSSSRIFVGKERNFSTQRQFGGFRFGGDPQDPNSQENDLDIVNYDVGNVNLYLHSGSGNINSTIGEFRFIYGKTDRILTTLNKNGRFRINSNSSPTEPSLDVVGFSTLRGDTYVGSDFYLAGDGKTQGDFEIGGRLVLNDATLAGATFTQDVLVGQDPTGGVGDGVGIGTSGSVIASKSLIVWGVGAAVFEAASTGDVTIAGSANVTNSVIANLVDTNNVELETSMVGPANYSLDSTGMSVDSTSTGTLKAVGGTMSLRSPIEYYTLGITSTTITVDNIEVAESISGNFNITADNITILDDLTVSSDIRTQNVFATGITSTASLDSDVSSIGEASASSLAVVDTITGDDVTSNTGTFNGLLNVDEIAVTSGTFGNFTNSPVFNQNAEIVNTLTVGVIAAGDIIADNITATNVSISSVTSNILFGGNVTINGTLNSNNLVTNNVSAVDGSFTELEVNRITTAVTFDDNVSIAGTITAGDVQVANMTVDNVTAQTLSVNNVTSNVNFDGNIQVTESINGASIGVVTATTTDLTAVNANITNIVNNVNLSGNVSIPGTLNAANAGFNTATATELNATNASIVTFDSSPTFSQGMSVSGTLSGDTATFANVNVSSNLFAAQAGFTTVLGDVEFTGEPTFQNMNAVEAGLGTITVSEATISNLTVGSVDSATLNINDLSAQSGVFSGSVTAESIITDTGTIDTLTVPNISGDVDVSNSLDVPTLGVSSTANIAAANITSGTFGTIANATFTTADLTTANITDANIDNADVDTGTVTDTLTVNNLVVNGNFSGGYTVVTPPVYPTLEVTDLTASDLNVTGTATIASLDVTTITSNPNIAGAQFTADVTAGVIDATSVSANSSSATNLTAINISATNLTVGGATSFTSGTVEFSDIVVDSNATIDTAAITNASISVLTGNAGGDISITTNVISTNDIEVENLTANANIAANKVVVGSNAGVVFENTAIAMSAGFTAGNNLFLYIEDDSGNFVGYASLELTGSPTDSF